MRLDKFLSNMGIGSRTEVKNILKMGIVTVNESVEKNGKKHIDVDKDVVMFEGSRIEYKPFIYLMLNKPKDYISATEPGNHYPAVIELVPEEFRHYDLFPVGRLDVDTEGLLVLTNDGVLAHDLLSPKKHVPKKYFAILDHKITAEDINIFLSGIKLDDEYICLPAELTDNVTREDAKTGVYVTLHEGKNHQVKRMFEALGNEVKYLKRIQMGNLILDETLELGEIKELSREELELLSGTKEK